MQLLSIGMQGLQMSQRQAHGAAQAIASGTAPDADLVTPLIELKQAELQAKADVKVIAAADRMIGTLVDIKV